MAIEVQKNLTNPANYAPERFDYIWFTPPNDGPCEKYKALEDERE